MAKLRVDKIAAVGVSTETTGSVFFDGTDDHLAVADSDDFNFGTSDFTIEFWMKPALEDTSAYDGDFSTILDHDADAATNGAWFAIHQVDKKIRIAFDNVIKITTSDFLDIQSWHHVALTRSGNTFTVFGNGVDVGNTTDTHDLSDTNTRELTIGKQFFSSNNRLYNGYLSNLRILKGTALYTSNSAPPATELEVHLETVLLCCHDGEDIFADKTGRHIIAAIGDRTSSPTPTATDSPIGITTVSPGLIRDVDNTFGPTFQGGAAYSSQNWLTLPKGTTTERNQTGGRGLIGGGTISPTVTNVINYVTLSSAGNSFDFGDLTDARHSVGSCASSTRGLFGGGGDPNNSDIIDYVTIASEGNAVDFGDLFDQRRGLAGCGNQTRGMWGGGYDPGISDVIDFVTIASLGGTAGDFGNLTSSGRAVLAAASSPTRGIWAGGLNPTVSNVIDFVTIATQGDATSFGILGDARSDLAGGSSSTRAIFGGGLDPGLDNLIDSIEIATTGNATSFGELSATRRRLGAMSNSLRVAFMGGSAPANLNIIEYVTIANTGNATDFGDLINQTELPTGCSDSHGGLS